MSDFPSRTSKVSRPHGVKAEKSLRRRFSELPLQRKIWLSNLASVLLLCLIFICGTELHYRLSMARIQSSMQEGLETVHSYFEKTGALIAGRLAQLDSSITVHQLLLAAEQGKSAPWSPEPLLKDLCIITEIDGIGLYTADGALAAGQTEGTPLQLPDLLLRQVLDAPGVCFWVDEAPYRNTWTDGVCVYRAFRTAGREPRAGIARASISNAVLSAACSDAVKRNIFDICLFTPKGNLLLPRDTERAVLNVSRDCFQSRDLNPGFERRDFEGRHYWIRGAPVAAGSLYAVSAVQEELLLQDIHLMQTILLLTGAVCVLTVYFITSYTGRLLTAPIQELSGKVQEVEAGNLNVRSANTGKDEVGMLAGNFNAMLDHIQLLIQENAQSEKKRYQLELLSLQTQVTPHFLYNSLDSIRALIHLGDTEGACEMSQALSEFYRGVLSGGRSMISVREEIRLTESYLQVQSTRYQGDFDYLVDIQPELMEAAIVKLTLQPLVENAIYHGIRNVRRRGLLKLRGRLLEDGGMLLSVWDNGAGMEEASVSARETKGDLILRQRGFGMYNADQRIKLYFGPQYGLRVSSEPGAWTQVDVCLPYKAYREFQHDFSSDY